MEFKTRFQHSQRKHGGMATTCIIYVDNSLPGEAKLPLEAVGCGNAKCNPGDVFNKAIGRKLALIRAIKNVDWLTREQRTEIWTNYLKRNKIK